MGESTLKINLREKALVLFAFAFIFFSLFIPLWEIGANHSVEIEKTSLLANLGEDGKRTEDDQDWYELSSSGRLSVRLSSIN